MRLEIRALGLDTEWGGVCVAAWCAFSVLTARSENQCANLLFYAMAGATGGFTLAALTGNTTLRVHYGEALPQP